MIYLLFIVVNCGYLSLLSKSWTNVIVWFTDVNDVESFNRRTV